MSNISHVQPVLQQHHHQMQLVRQKEEIFSQFNERYQKAKTFWKSKFDELLNEKKK